MITPYSIIRTCTILVVAIFFSSVASLDISAAPSGPVTPPILTLSGVAVDTITVGSGFVSPNFLVETNVAHTFSTGGVAQGWNADDQDWDYTLPFSFTYYGVTYATGYTIKISSNGRICFDNTQSCNVTSGNVTYAPYGPQIAPLWRDLYTANGGGDDIYIAENTGSVTFRWQATDCCGPDYEVNFSVTLFQNGQIRFDYGDQPVAYDVNNIYQSIGVSSGDGAHYTLSSKASLSSYDNISSSLWDHEFGYDDPGVLWTDNTDGSGVILRATSGSVDVNTIGTYTLEYTYTNSQGTGATITRTVNVVPADAIPPTITLVGSGTVNISQDSNWSDSGATWSDNVDGTGTIATASSGSVNVAVAGTYPLIYQYVDVAGNTGSTTRTVVVTAPIISAGAGGGGGGSYVAPAPTQPSTIPQSTAATPIVVTYKNIAQDTFEVDNKTSKKPKILTTTTTLKNGTKVAIYRTLPNGKELKIGTARVVRGVIKYQVRSSGKYTFSTH